MLERVLGRSRFALFGEGSGGTIRLVAHAGRIHPPIRIEGEARR
jgi:hypothetical protein